MKRKTKKRTRYARQENGTLVLDMNRINLDKQMYVPAFRTGRHMTEKDRPRKKRWSVDDTL